MIRGGARRHSFYKCGVAQLAAFSPCIPALRGEEVHVAADVAGNDQFEGVRKCTATRFAIAGERGEHFSCLTFARGAGHLSWQFHGILIPAVRLRQRGEVFQKHAVNEDVTAAHLAQEETLHRVVEEANIAHRG